MHVRSMFSLALSGLLFFGTAADSGATIGGDDYLDKTIEKGVVRWPKMPLRVYIHNQNQNAEYDKILKESFLDWDRCSKGLVCFTFVSEQPEADITVEWVRNQEWLSNRLAVAETKIYRDLSGIARAHISLSVVREKGDFSPRDVRKMCLYGVGRALGLYGKTDNPSDVMYDRLPEAGDNRSVSISQRDCRTLTLLYTLDVASTTWPRFVGPSTL